MLFIFLKTHVCFFYIYNLILDYDWSSGEFSSWSESTWDEMHVRMFLRPSKAQENMTIAVGTITVILSFVLVYFIKSRSHIFFTEIIVAEAPTDC